MYEYEEKFSIKTVIIQFLFVVLFVFLLLWLFPTKEYVKKNVNNSNNSIDSQISDAIAAKLQPFYNQIFSQNLDSMKEGAKSYFTTPRLPQNIGESKRMTLREMLEKKLVLPFSDSNGKECDLYNSYVEVTKADDEYILRVNLSCSDKSDYIDVYMGCYNYCESSICEKQTEVTPASKDGGSYYPSKDGGSYVAPTVKKYICEYEKVTDGKWGNWSDWSKWSDTRVTKTEYREVQTKTEKRETGEEKVQTGTKTEVVDALKTETVTYTCPSGYVQSGQNCVKNESIESTTLAIKNTETTYTCPSGYTKSGTGSSTKCSKKSTKSATAKAVYTCPSGYTKSGTGSNTKCSKKSTKNATAKTSYYCQTGTLSGTKCSYNTYANPIYITSYSAWSSWSSPKSFSYTPVDTTTTKYKYYSTTVNTNCKSNCNKYTYHYRVSTRTATQKINCPSGYTKSGSTCYKITSSQAKKKTTYTCPSGYKLNGTKCSKTTTKKATKTNSYTCPSGYTKSGTGSSTKCVKTATTSYIKTTNNSYSCKTGTLSGENCIILSEQSTTIPATENKNVTYSCASDYTLEGDKCIKEVPVYENVKTYEDVIYYRYRTKDYLAGTRDIKWSNCSDNSLLKSGYSLTGKKKEA